MSDTESDKTNLLEILDEEEKNDVVYIKPRLEMKLSPQKKQECRDIVLEIKKFGVNQRQIMFILELLSAELENMEHVRKFKQTIVECREDLSDSKIILD